MFPISIATKLIAAAAAFALVVGGVSWAVHAIRDNAVQADRERAKAAFEQLEGQADVGSKDVRDCAIAGRIWDRARGVCLEPSSGQ